VVVNRPGKKDFESEQPGVWTLLPVVDRLLSLGHPVNLTLLAFTERPAGRIYRSLQKSGRLENCGTSGARLRLLHRHDAEVRHAVRGVAGVQTLDHLAANAIGSWFEAGGVHRDSRARISCLDTWASPVEDDTFVSIQMGRVAGYGEQLSGQYIQRRRHAGQCDWLGRVDRAKSEDEATADAKSVQVRRAHGGTQMEILVEVVRLQQSK
jgi:hypothetical protein